ncbi:MAG: TonB-dependent receptor plug domain-containing protein [Candidatus Euphemobacter frigidus]|nr:TonB-dependent receptor plug domain-containing protein [Candidatus Euphemobacter frigidus]MDP8275969.1 TonB-dependent receptor plug domain-containing protein [Candidatus Euphemobacter frigidus]
MKILVRYRLVVFILPFITLTGIFRPAGATETSAEYTAPSREELAWMEIPEVITPARKPQPITQAPASVSVITAEEIRPSGLTNIPDILRRLAGVDVMELSPGDIQVGIRGLNATISNKILVMINGRSVYMDFYGTTMWSTLPVLLEEIERIEVVRGPGSALYGANAFCGVINIITKDPRELAGTHLSGSAGTVNTFRGTAIQAGEINDFAYKLAAGWKEQGFWEDRHQKSLENFIADGTLSYSLDREKEIALDAGINTGKDDLVVEESQGHINLDGYVSYINASYRQPELALLSY